MFLSQIFTVKKIFAGFGFVDRNKENRNSVLNEIMLLPFFRIGIMLCTNLQDGVVKVKT